MSNAILTCRRICCGRKSNKRSKNTTTTNKSDLNQIKIPPSFEDKKITKDSSKLDPLTDDIISTPNQLHKISNNIDLDRLTKEYLETINEYRFRLGFLSLELSNELTNRALHRATQLSIQNRIENTNRFDLIHNNEPIGETVMSCRAPVNNGYDIAQLLHDQLINDLNTGHSPKKRYTPILNPDCQYLGFGLVHNEEKTKDFIVIYYYP